MIREIGLRILIFALPFGIFWLYLFVMRWKPGHVTPKTPWTILFLIGLSLFALSFVIWRFAEGGQTQGIYVPPHVENGRVVPGRMDGGR